MNGWVTPWLIGLLDAYEDGWLHGWMVIWTDGQMEERTDGWMNGWVIVSDSRLDGSLDNCMDPGRVDGCWDCWLEGCLVG